MITKNNSLIKHALPFFQLLSVFMKNNEQSKDIQQEDFVKICDQLKINLIDQNMEQVLYALAALADELVLNSDWQGKSSWMKSSLQSHYFNEHLAGETFFKRLDELRKDPVKYLDVIEIYYICLQFGFRGNYRHEQQTYLKTICNEIYNQIKSLRGDLNDEINHLLLETIPHKTKFLITNKLIIGVTLSILICFSAILILAFTIEKNVVVGKLPLVGWAKVEKPNTCASLYKCWASKTQPNLQEAPLSD